MTARATAAAMELATVAAVVVAQEVRRAVVAAAAMDSEAVGWAPGRVAAMAERAAVRMVEAREKCCTSCCRSAGKE